MSRKIFKFLATNSRNILFPKPKIAALIIYIKCTTNMIIRRTHGKAKFKAIYLFYHKRVSNSIMKHKALV